MGTGCAKPKEERKKDEEINKAMFDFKKVIGKGGFGRVWKVIEKKGRKVFAMKVMDKAKIITKKSVNSVLNQRQILCRLSNPFIVNMYTAFQDRQNLYLLMDYLEGGDLRYYINRQYPFNQQQIKFVIRCMMEGLKYLHENNIIHRDIKPENIIFDKNGYCRITDLGIARYWKSQNSHQTSGTPGYMAPQVLLRQNHSFCVDYYAVGIIAYQLVLGKRPYMGKDRKQIRDQMLARQAKIPNSFKGLSQEGIDFINKMIQRQSKKRLGYNGIQQILSHPWLKIQLLQNTQFNDLKLQSPITTLHISYHQSLQQVTVPDQVWRQNILLLKRPQTQKLFADYNFSPYQKQNMRFASQSTVSGNFDQSISINLERPEKEKLDKIDKLKSYNSLNFGSQNQLGDIISFCSTRRSSLQKNK